MSNVNRRKVLALGLAAGSLSAFPNSALPQSALDQSGPKSPALVSKMADAASQFLATLDGQHLRAATFDSGDDAERTRWHWTVNSTFPRNGLALLDMNARQKDAAYALLSASLSPIGYQKARSIMELQNEVPFAGADPELFFVSVFGQPGTQSWGWRFEGHHLSQHFTVEDDRVAMVPFFHGALPTRSKNGSRSMPREEDAAREFVQSFAPGERSRVIFQQTALRRHETQNHVRVEPLATVGAAMKEVAGGQQELVMEILKTYLSSLPEPVAAWHMQRIKAQGFGDVTFGWSGDVEPNRPQYYRIQGRSFLLEFDNSRNSGTHIHSVWRDFDHDFGQSLRST